MITNISFPQAIIILLCLITLNGQAQVDSSSDTRSFPLLQEKLHVHTDRTFYTVGEMIWYKVYLFDAHSNLPVNSSKVAYIEMIGPEGKVVEQQKIALDSAVGNGSLYIPLQAASGNYLLRFYTRWMLNFDEDHYYTLPITVVNPFVKLQQQASAGSPPPDIQFFPEGGELVSGLTSRIAVKVTDEKQQGLPFRGAITNASGDTVTVFSSLRFGMGSFYFTPADSISYTAFIAVHDSTYHVPLPPIAKEGVVMALHEQNDQLLLQVQKSPGIQIPVVRIHITGTDQVAKSYTLSFTGNGGELKIPIADVPPGISTFTVETLTGIPLAERLYFKIPEERLMTLKADSDQEMYGKRKKVQVTISGRTNSGLKSPGSFSMAVFKFDSLEQFPHSNISSSIWLTSELKGKIEFPHFYLNPKNEKVREATQNLMLTHGWRRIVRKIPHKDSLRHLPELEAHILKIVITNAATGKAIAGKNAYLTIPGNDFKFYTSVSNEQGELWFLAKDFYTSAPAILTLESGSANAYNFNVISPYSNTPVYDLLPLHVDSSTRSAIEERSLSMQVTNVFFKDFISHSSVFSDRLAFFGLPDKTYFLDEYTRFPTLQEVMVEYIPEVQLRQRNKEFQLRVSDYPFARFFDAPPLLLVDGVPIMDSKDLMVIDPLRIEKIDLISRRFISGDNSFPGIVSYTSYDGEKPLMVTQEESIQLELEGLATERQFYSPKYDHPETDPRTPDYRTLLYWNPNLNLQEKTKMLEFYTGDLPGTYIGIIEGRTEDGKLGTTTFQFTVTD